MRPRILDLFCGAGGCAMGYYRAGFDVVGVDLNPQPRYPFELHQADAMEYPLDGFDAIHASPPCQAYSKARQLGHRGRNDHPMLIDAIRERLIAADVPYVIENVEGAISHMRNPIMLCGSAFGLDVQRHRLFEINFSMLSPGCHHGLWKRNRFPGTPRHDGTKPMSRIVNPMASECTHEDMATAMGIDWMPKSGRRPTNELREAIPPAYTEHIGGYLLAEVRRREGVAA